MDYTVYAVSTVLYGAVVVLGVFVAVYFFIKGMVFLSLIGLVLTLVSLDNFFCGMRAKNAGAKVKGRYVIPFMRKK